MAVLGRFASSLNSKGTLFPYVIGDGEFRRNSTKPLM